MRKVVLLLLFLIVPISGRETSDQVNLKTTEARYPFGKYEIIIKHQKRTQPLTQEQIDAGVRPIWCAAFLEILEKGKIIEKLNFEDIWPLGGDAGIFLPKEQASPKHFILAKYGSYDSRVLVITHEGKLFNLEGEYFRIFRHRYLVSVRSLADATWCIPIFDLENNRILETLNWEDLTKGLSMTPSGKTAYMAKLYSSGSELFVGVVQVNIETWDVIDHTDYFYKINLETGKLIPSSFDEKKYPEFIIDWSNMDLSHRCGCPRKEDK
jgi:hypothetical protein